MRTSCLGILIIACVLSAAVVSGQQRQGWPSSQGPTDSWQTRELDPLQVQSTIDALNEESSTRYGKQFIVKYHLDLGPLNRVQINPSLWNALNSRQRNHLGGEFAKAFRGTGLLFCQFFVNDNLVGKVRSDPIRGGLKYEPVR